MIILIPTSISITNIATGAQNQTKIISSGHYQKGYRYNVQGWIYIHIEGDPYDRGYQYGYLASGEIVDMIRRWSNWGHREKIMRLFPLKNYDELSEQWWKICKTRAVNRFWKQIPEEYKQEIKGIANGVKDQGGTIHGQTINYKDILTLNVIEECRQSFKNTLKRTRPIISGIIQLKDLIKQAKNPEDFTGHCNAFIATGDATVDGRIVMSHSTIFPPNYIPQRANIILDVKPTNGHRFLMTSFPGYIWSSEDYYQNEKGILLSETTLAPQGPWNERGLPVGIRARRAIQYSNSIDDVVNSLVNDNNGLYPNDWLIGDTKTGEIASLELAYFNHALTKTKNGFIWSCNNAKNNKVRWELLSIFGFGIIGRILFRKFRPNEKDLKFMELRDRYHGEIDVEVAKKIMSTPPLNKMTTDCKITDSCLVEKLGMWANMGCSDGNSWSPTAEQEKQLKGFTELPGAGWVKIYASESNPKNLPVFKKPISEGKTTKLLFIYENEEPRNTAYSESNVYESMVYTADSYGNILAWNPKKNKQTWINNIGDKTFKPEVSEDLVFVTSTKGLYAIEKETGKVKWKQLVGEISSKPTVAEKLVIVGCSNGNVYAFDINTGRTIWTNNFANPTVISEINNDHIYICSGETCYAFNIKKRDIKWEFETQGDITTSPSTKDSTVYFGSWDGNLYAVDTNSGKQKWVFETGWGIETTPTFSDDLVFFGSMDNNFYALDKKTGDMKWFFQCRSGIHSNPVVYGDFVFFGSDDGRLYALDKKTGDLGWGFSPGYSINDEDVNNFITTPILSDPVVEDGIVYISAQGNIYALDAQTIEIPNEEKTGALHDDNKSLIIFIIAIILIIVVLFLLFGDKKLGILSGNNK